uniref:Uncharacterized protein n=1 Tax=Branchiostoma floridae TaxID=7739 RepID=C3Y451_BRAFL|eukprot:XP_002609067.1 hypothetical protein BRAFLDRAFT_96908 [Branchiostoma floridae]
MAKTGTTTILEVPNPPTSIPIYIYVFPAPVQDNHNFASACGFMPDLMGVKETVGPGWFYMGSNIFWFAPWNIRGILHFVRERSQGLYGSIARENGFPDNANHVWMTRQWWEWCHMDEAYAPTRHGNVEPTNNVRPTQLDAPRRVHYKRACTEGVSGAKPTDTGCDSENRPKGRAELSVNPTTCVLPPCHREAESGRLSPA